MKRYIGYIIGLACTLGMAACKDSFNIDDLHEEVKLVVNCFPSTEDTTWIEVTHSIPISKGAKASQWDDYMEVTNAHIIYKVNGEPRTVGWKDRLYNAVGRTMVSGKYYVTGQQQAGDHIEIDVSAPGYASVSAETVVAPEVPVTLHAVSEVNVYDYDWGGNREVYQLAATFTDPIQTTDYYAVRIRCKFYRGTAIGDMWPDIPQRDYWTEEDKHVEWLMKSEEKYEDLSLLGWTDVYDFHLQLDSIYSWPEILPLSEPLLQSLTELDSDFGFSNSFYQDFYIFSDATINGQTYTLHLDLSPYDLYRHGLRQHYDIQECTFRPIQYQVQLYHLTPEVYHYVKSLNDKENNDLAEAGLSLISPTFTNVRNGIGIVGGYCMAESQWMTLTAEN